MKKLLLLSIIALSASFASAQWQLTNGPYGGIVTCSAVLGTDIFVGTKNGVFLSTNNGNNWLSVGFVDTIINCLATKGSDIFAGTSNGLYRSSNFGLSWTSISSGISCISIYGNKIFISTGRDIYLSNNNGNSWTMVNSPCSSSNMINALTQNGTYIFASVNSQGVYRSSDDGNIWTLVNYGLPYVTGNMYFVYELATEGNNIYAVCNGSVLYKSTNNGNIWSLLHTSIGSLLISGDTILAGNYPNGIIISLDSGSSWTPIGPVNESIGTIEKIGNNIFTAARHGMCLTQNNGINWTDINSGLIDQSFNSMTNSGNKIFVSESYGTIFQSSDSGNTWTVSASNNSGFFSGLASYGNNIFAGSNNYFYRSTDLGNSWITLNSGLPSTPEISSIVFKDSNIFIGTNNGVYKSSDQGNTWSAANTGITGFSVTCMAVQGNIIYAGTHSHGIFKSSDNGNLWTAINNGLDWQYVYKSINGLVTSGSKIFAGFQMGLYCSADSGLHWTLVNMNLTNPFIISLFSKDYKIFAGVYNSGVYFSSDTGANWQALNDGLLNKKIFAFGTDGNNIYAAAYLGGLWKRDLSLITGIDAIENDDGNNAILYPNPASIAITIDGFSNNAMAEVYDISGNILISRKLIKNQIDISSLAPGLYFIKLSTAEGSVVRKFVKE
jgi:photosystem II stability/assembly factor-like uncharacterized protein